MSYYSPVLPNKNILLIFPRKSVLEVLFRNKCFSDLLIPDQPQPSDNQSILCGEIKKNYGPIK